MDFKRIYSHAPWEKEVGYCRVLQAGNHVFITGTAPIDENGNTYQPQKPYEQAKRCLEIIQDSLAKLNIPMSQIVRTRMYVTDIALWREYGRAHREFFQSHPPVTTMVQVSQLIQPDMMIEIEADAICL